MFVFHSIMPNEEVFAASFFLLYKMAIVDDLITYSWAHYIFMTSLSIHELINIIILVFKPMAKKDVPEEIPWNKYLWSELDPLLVVVESRRPSPY